MTQTIAPRVPAAKLGPSAKPGGIAPRALRLAIAGGGTGGHVVPGVHLLQHMAQGVRPASVLWFGAGRRAENTALCGVQACLGRDVAFEKIDLSLEPRTGGAPRVHDLVLRTPPAARVARRALARSRADVVCGLGGFTVLPVVLAARSLGLPVVLLEVNATSGRATRWLTPLVDRVLYAFGPTMPGSRTPRSESKHRFVGPPLGPGHVAPCFDAALKRAVKIELGFDPDRELLVVLGGSQGAQSLNRFARERLEALHTAGLSVLHQVGPGRLQEAASERPHYRAVEFASDVASVLRAADLVLTRGGASTLAEISAAGTPAVVVPYPHHRDGHQRANAEAIGEGLTVVDEGPNAFDLVQSALLALLRDPARRERSSGALRRAVPLDGAARLLEELILLSTLRVSHD